MIPMRWELRLFEFINEFSNLSAEIGVYEYTEYLSINDYRLSLEVKRDYMLSMLRSTVFRSD